jgi:hypothetical protein
MEVMSKGTIAQTKRKYLAIKARYEELNKLDDKGRPVYTYSNLMSKLSKEFYLQERTIGEILLLDIDAWERKERKSVPTQPILFPEPKTEEQ